METLLLYFIKVNGLLIVFYLAYYFLLRKETFFQSNRWFLLIGILSSFLLPLITYTEIVWIDPEPISYTSDTIIPVTNFEPTVIPKKFDWQLFFTSAYIFVSFALLIKILIELFSFIKIIKNGNKIKTENIYLVETDKSQNPFSFFNYLVFNKESFTEEELEMIIIHEKVHIVQKHSIDVLIGKLICTILWINPISWLYRKAILENLEFIADSLTTKNSNNIYDYQKTLLKTVVSNNQLSITNQFYQSLIKKRIVMLNTSPSNQKKSWKYALILPFLSAFMLLFQVETLAQVREAKAVKTAVAVEVVQFLITKNTTDADIKKEIETFKKEHEIDLKISKVKRNSSNEITGLSISYKDKDGNTGQLSRKSDTPIEPIVFYKELDKNGNKKIGFGDQQMTDFATAIAFDEAIEIDVDSDIEWVSTDNENLFTEKTKEPHKKVFITKKDGKEEKQIFFINDNEVTKIEMNELDPEVIEQVNVLKNNNGKKEIKIITKNSHGIDEDIEIYINGLKSSKVDLDAIKKEHIEMVNIKNLNNQKVIEIQKKVQKEVDEKVQKMNYNFEWNDDETGKVIKKDKDKMGVDKAEMNKMKAELAKTKAELEKLKEELKKKK